MERIIIEERQSKTARFCLTGVLLTVFGMISWLYGRNQRIAGLTILGGFCTIIFLTLTIFMISRILKPKALFTITLEGIEDDSENGGMEFLSFDDILRFHKVNVFGHEMIGVIPKDTEQFIHKLPMAKQRTARANVKMNLPPITLQVDKAKDMSIEDIISLLEKRLSDYSRLYN